MTTARRTGRRARVVIVSGLSGSGKSTVAKAFEDIGYFCVDNVPPVLLPRIVDLVTEARGTEARIALVGDVRGREFLPDFARVIEDLRRERHDVHVLFFDASDEAILRRFSETRRKHPMAAPGGGAKEAIRRERDILAPLREMADAVIDTSGYTVHQLRDSLLRRFRGGKRGLLQVGIVSFGYRYGLPAEADMVVDVRFLPNPNFVPGLKDFTGLDRRVRDHVMRFDITRRFLARLTTFLKFLLPLYIKEGKSYFTLGVGCTGGVHRSVALAEELARTLGGRGVSPVVVHRDLARQSGTTRSSP